MAIIRPLHAWEETEARKVFGSSLHYERVRVHEVDPFPDNIDRLGRWLKRMAPLQPDQHNAITLGNACYFPILLPDQPPQPAALLDFRFPWLIHELTHVWQYQHGGWGYVFKALAAQFRGGESAYDYGGTQNLADKRTQGWTLTRFNPEQQGNIVQDAYSLLCRSSNSGDPTADTEGLAKYLPYIQDLQTGS